MFDRAEYNQKWAADNADSLKVYQRKYYLANKEKMLAKSKTYHAENPEKVAAYRKTDAWKKTRRTHNLKKRYGLTVAQYETMLAAQGGACAVCRCDKPGGVGTWHVDHDHATAKVRGILCHGCNTGSKLTDNPALLRAKAIYLEKE